jgi:hypothetical protein
MLAQPGCRKSVDRSQLRIGSETFRAVDGRIHSILRGSLSKSLAVVSAFLF